MKAYRTYLTITDPRQLVITDLPFSTGQRVEVLLLAQEEGRIKPVRELESLLKETQAIGRTEGLTEEDISAEIAAYRSGQ